MIILILIYVIILYISLFFFFPRLIIPHLEFSEEKAPERLPEGMKEKINELKFIAKSAEEFLRLAYDYLGSRFRSERFNTFFKFFYLFKTVNEAWPKDGYLPCTVNNYLLKIFLVKSGWFKEADIKRRHAFVNFVIHQYL